MLSTKELKIGSLVLPYRFVQSPLSGYSDYAMRKLARDFGCPFTFAGVMLAKSAANPRVLRKSEFHPHDDEHPVGAQIVGEEPEIMVKAAKDLVAIGYDLIDLNFACPAPKVLRRQRGGYLLNNPRLVREIIEAVRDVVMCPLTIKLRSGWDNSQESIENVFEICDFAKKTGIDAITIHGRTVEARYKGTADWGILAEIKRSLGNVTILGSGDLFEPHRIVELMQQSGLDGVSIARGAVGNPWIFRDLKAMFTGADIPAPPTIKEQSQIIRQHFELLCKLYLPKKAVVYFRKFLAQYCRRHPDRKKVQTDFVAARTASDLAEAIVKWYGDNDLAAQSFPAVRV
ncbi:MAG: tRNA-dihydrouridine synthase [Phycisphaerae bacterium]|nr:tRNA-dihydrouridine synthase [Phycisphaerae bacterium]